MQKRQFMPAMTQLGDKALHLAVLAGKLQLKEADGVKKKDIDKSTKDVAAVTKEANAIYDLVQKSVKAYFNADNKTKYNTPKFKDNLAVYAYRHPVSGTVDQIKTAIVSLAREIEADVLIHTETPKVFHDNGSSWKKNSNDKARFTKIKKSVANVSKIVS